MDLSAEPGRHDDWDDYAARAWALEEELLHREALKMGAGQGIGQPAFSTDLGATLRELNMDMEVEIDAGGVLRLRLEV